MTRTGTKRVQEAERGSCQTIPYHLQATTELLGRVRALESTSNGLREAQDRTCGRYPVPVNEKGGMKVWAYHIVRVPQHQTRLRYQGDTMPQTTSWSSYAPPSNFLLWSWLDASYLISRFTEYLRSSYPYCAEKDPFVANRRVHLMKCGNFEILPLVFGFLNLKTIHKLGILKF